MSLSVTLTVLVSGLLSLPYLSLSSLPFPQDRLPPSRTVAIVFLGVEDQGACPPAFSDEQDNCTALFDAYAPLCSSVFERSVCKFANPQMCDICYEVLRNCTYNTGTGTDPTNTGTYPTSTTATATPSSTSDICNELYSALGTFCSFVLEGNTCSPGFSSESCETCLGALQICGPGPTNGSICDSSTAEFCPLLLNTTCAMESNGTGQICDLCDIVSNSNCGSSDSTPTSPPEGSGGTGYSCNSLFETLGDYCTYVITNGQCDATQYSQESCDQCESVEILCGLNPPNSSYTICQSTISIACPYIIDMCGPSNSTFICDYCETVNNNCQTSSIGKRQTSDICTSTFNAFGSFCNYVVQEDGACFQSFSSEACSTCQTVRAQCPVNDNNVCDASTVPNCPTILQMCSDQKDSNFVCDYCSVVEQECTTQTNSNETLDCPSTKSTFGLFCKDVLDENVCPFTYSEHSCLICEFLNTTCGFYDDLSTPTEFCNNSLAVSCTSTLLDCMGGGANTQQCDYCAFVAKTCFDDQKIDICNFREVVGGCRQLSSTSFGFECECFLPKVMCDVCQTVLDVCPPGIPTEVAISLDDLTDMQRENVITLRIGQVPLDKFLAHEYLFRLIIAELVKSSLQSIHIEGASALTENNVYIVLPSPLVSEEGDLDIVFFIQLPSNEVVVSGEAVINMLQMQTTQLLSETFSAAIGSNVIVGEIEKGLPSSLQPARGQVAIGVGVGVTVGIIALLIVTTVVVVTVIAIKVKHAKQREDDENGLMGENLEEVKMTSI